MNRAIVGTDGKALTTERCANLVIYKSETGEDPWEPVKLYNVPEWIKEPEVIRQLVNGMACTKDEKTWYAAQEVTKH